MHEVTLIQPILYLAHATWYFYLFFHECVVVLNGLQAPYGHTFYQIIYVSNTY